MESSIMKKMSLLLAVMGPIACVGCNAAKILAVTSDATSSIVNGSLIVGAAYLAKNGQNILDQITQLLGGQ